MMARIGVMRPLQRHIAPDRMQACDLGHRHRAGLASHPRNTTAPAESGVLFSGAVQRGSLHHERNWNDADCFIGFVAFNCGPTSNGGGWSLRHFIG